MDDKELEYIFKEWKQFLSWCYENNDKTLEIYIDKVKYVMNYTSKLQSNWNSLREWLESRTNNFQEDVSTPILHEQIVCSLILDKMNELEGGIKNEDKSPSYKG